MAEKQMDFADFKSVYGQDQKGFSCVTLFPGNELDFHPAVLSAFFLRGVVCQRERTAETDIGNPRGSNSFFYQIIPNRLGAAFRKALIEFFRAGIVRVAGYDDVDLGILPEHVGQIVELFLKIGFDA